MARYLQRQGLLESDVENSYLTLDDRDDEVMNQLLGHSITYRIAVGPQQGRKVLTLQTLPACDLDEVEEAHADVSNILLQVLDDSRMTDGHGA